MKTINRLDIINYLQEIKEKYAQEGVVLLGLFGSYAREESDAYSDVDIAYTLDRKRFSQHYKDGFSKILRLEEIKETLEKYFQKKVDLVSLNSSNERLIEHIKKEIIYV